ncbi:ABC transporter ATP-binding protein [Abyssisolibacter fermentans]|uniref:ABC transporter ATP-binding protein n=1 Tax=Abyssisolibacter fermentans TaxID=1766203 RepID=UPI00082AA688|nr:ABC transporter ATP-binding protein [Abyssisolibacter fermentans]
MKYKNSDLKKISCILKLMLPLKKYAILAAIATLLIILLSMVVPYFNMILVDEVILNKNILMYKNVMILWILLILIKPSIEIIKNRNLALFDIHFDRQIRKKMMDKIMYLPLSYFDKEQKGYIQARMNGDIAALYSIGAGAVIKIFSDITKLIVGLIMLFKINSFLTLITLLLIPLVIINNRIFFKKIKKMRSIIQEHLANIRGFTVENLMSIEIIKFFNFESLRMNQFDQLYDENVKLNKKNAYLNIKINFIKQLISSIIPFAIWAVGAWMAIKGEMTLGEITAFVGYMGLVYGPAISIFSLKLNLQGAVVAWERINEILKIEDEKSDNENRLIPTIENGDIEYKNVSFKYSDQSDYIIKNLNLAINKGEKVTIIGANGSGKSTMLKLLLGLYNHYEGSITIDDQEINQCNVFEIRNQIAYMSQDIMLFRGSILDNIRCFNAKITCEEVKQLIKSLNLEDIFQEYGFTLDKMVNEQGKNLSGGQRQLISFLRVMIKKHCKIIILDEGTSAFDSKIEELIYDRMQFLCKDKTIINISHKKTFIDSSSRILVLKDGKLSKKDYSTVLTESSI